MAYWIILVARLHLQLHKLFPVNYLRDNFVDHGKHEKFKCSLESMNACVWHNIMKDNFLTSQTFRVAPLQNKIAKKKTHEFQTKVKQKVWNMPRNVTEKC